MTQKKLALMGLLAFTIGTTNVVEASSGEIGIKLNGAFIAQTKDMGFAYIDKSNSRTMVPLRFVSENLGFNVGWDNKTQTATITEGDTTVQIAIGSKAPKVNGVTKTIDAAATLKNGRTYVPVRFISEAMGETVNYKDSTVFIGSGDMSTDYLPIPKAPSIGATATYNYDTDSKVLMEWLGEYLSYDGALCDLPEFENSFKHFNVSRYYPEEKKEYYDVSIDIVRWATNEDLKWLKEDFDTPDNFQIQDSQLPKAYFKEVLKFYLPNGGDKLFDIINKGKNGLLSEPGKYMNTDLQDMIGSDGKKVKLVYDETFGHLCVRITKQ